MGRLEDELTLAICPAPCRQVFWMEKVLLPGGEEKVRRGRPRPPLCASCPERDNPSEAAPRPVTIVLDYRGRFPGFAPAPTVPQPEEEPEPEEQAVAPTPEAEAHDDGLPIPPGWGLTTRHCSRRYAPPS